MKYTIIGKISLLALGLLWGSQSFAAQHYSDDLLPPDAAAKIASRLRLAHYERNRFEAPLDVDITMEKLRNFLRKEAESYGAGLAAASTFSETEKPSTIPIARFSPAMSQVQASGSSPFNKLTLRSLARVARTILRK